MFAVEWFASAKKAMMCLVTSVKMVCRGVTNERGGVDFYWSDCRIFYLNSHYRYTDTKGKEEVVREERVEKINRWALLWWYPQEALARNKRGKTWHVEHLIYENYLPKLFRSRKQAREFSETVYGYIRGNKPLNIYPHFWRVPKPVKVTGIKIKVKS